MKRQRVKCVRIVGRFWDGSPRRSLPDPQITVGKFYPLLDAHVRIMGNEDPHYSVLGDDGQEATRPACWFRIMEGGSNG